MREGVVTLWRKQVDSLNHIINKVPDPKIRSELTKILNRSQFRPYNNTLFDGEQVISLLDEIEILLNRCNLPESIEKYVVSKFKEIKNTVTQGKVKYDKK